MKYIYSLLLCEILFLVSCSKPTPPNDPIPEHDTFTITSQHLGEERVINVWIPKGYKTSTDSLPVMYMADGV